MIKGIIVYTLRILKHKWFVFIECLRLGIPWRGITHDLSKFSRAEFMPYMRRLTMPLLTGESPTAEEKERFDVACLHHYHKNTHHWFSWLYFPKTRWVVVDHGPGDCGCISRNGYETNVCEIAPRATTYRDDIGEIVVALKHSMEALPMPHKDVLEMVADWRAMSREFNSDTGEWYFNQKGTGCIVLHADTMALVERLLEA